MQSFTIGFLGRHRFTELMRNYVDSLIIRYSSNYDNLCVLLSLQTIYEHRIAERVIAVKQICPSLKLTVVITLRQEKDYNLRKDSVLSQSRNKIIGNADYVKILPERNGFFEVENMYRFFIYTCDLIVFCPFNAGIFVKYSFEKTLRTADRRPVVRYLDLELPVPKSNNLDAVLALAKSIEYIRSNNFKLMSDKVPTALLKEWVTDNPRPYYKYFTTINDIADIFRLYDGVGKTFLPFKVFAYCYAIYRNLWAFTICYSLSFEEINRSFSQFQKILRLIIEIRAKGADAGSYNIIDFDNYDEIVERLGWLRRQDELNGTLCDGDAECMVSGYDDCI